MTNQDVKRVITGEVRTSYSHLTKARAANPGENPKFSVTLLIPKSDFATKQRIDAAIQAAIQDGITSKWNGKRPPNPPHPVHDGDGVRQSGDPFSEECKGCWVMTASSMDPPQIVDAGLNPIINTTEIYSGMYARVSVRFYPYAANGKMGIAAGLGNVQKTRDGEPLGGSRASAESDFGGYPQAAPAYQQPQPQYPPQPQFQPAIDPITGQPVQPPIMGI